METAFNSTCGSMAQSYYESLTTRPNVIDKSRGWSHYWDWVSKWNPEPKMVCMVRDLRNVLCSFERKYRESRSQPVGPDNPHEMLGITFDQRCEHWLSTKPLGLALLRLKEGLERKLPILYLKYEDLTDITKTQGLLDQWYEHVGMESFSHTFDEVKKEVEEDYRVYGPYGSHEVGSEVKASSTNWKDTMSPETSKDLRNVYSWFFDRFEYV